MVPLVVVRKGGHASAITAKVQTVSKAREFQLKNVQCIDQKKLCTWYDSDDCD